MRNNVLVFLDSIINHNYIVTTTILRKLAFIQWLLIIIQENVTGEY